MAIPVALVAFIIDDSGSMKSLAPATCAAFNAYVDVLKKTKGAEIRFSAYPLESATPYQSDVPVQDALTLTDGTDGGGNYRPFRSSTPLFMTVRDVIDKLEETLKRVGPRKVVVCIQTDGVDPTDVTSTKRRIQEKQCEGWEFVFMGTHDKSSTQQVARSLGIPHANYMFYSSNQRATLAAFSAAGWNVGAYTSGRAANAGFTEEQQRQAKG